MTTNKTEKMTNRKALTYVLDECSIPADVREKLEAMIAALDKKSSAERKPTAKQTANAALRAELVAFIEDNAEGDGFTVSDLIKVCPAVEGQSNQYVSSILRQAVLAGEISKGSVKRRTYFAPAGQYPAPTEDEGEYSPSPPPRLNMGAERMRRERKPSRMGQLSIAVAASMLGRGPGPIVKKITFKKCLTKCIKNAIL